MRGRAPAVVTVLGFTLACSWAPAMAVEHVAAVDSFGSNATAAPIKIELYEPTIPVPATPQAELSMDFTHVEASSGPTGRARASLSWPGGPVGEGLPTFAAALGLPPDLFKDGYPVQVNATFPGDHTEERQEPFPGNVQRVSSSADKTIAKAAFDSGGDVKEPGDGDDGGGGLGDLGGLLPSLPGLPGTKGSTKDAAGPATDDPQDPFGAFAAVVDVGGITSLSSTTYGDEVVSTAVSKVNDLALLGGLVEIDGITVMTSSTADLSKASSTYEVSYTGMTVVGVPFKIGRDGVEAVGKPVPIPGLPDNPAKALETLGISFELPKAQRTDKDLSSALAIQGLKVTLDLKTLKPVLSKLPLGDLAGKLPDQAGQLKSLLGSIGGLSPRIVLLLGNASTEATALPPIELPAPAGGGGPAGGGKTGGTGGGLGGTTSSGPPADSANVPVEPGDVAETPPLQTVASTPGLPDLASIPGLLLIGGLALGALGGGWLRRMGLLVLTAGSTCSHGLAGGVPDLRKIGT